MTRQQLTTPQGFFDPWTHQSFGLDNIFQAMEQFNHQPNQKYPPYNIVKTDTTYVLEFALAGWKMDELSAVLEKNVLTVSGKKPEDESTEDVIHRGIANRSFRSQFTIGDSVQIKDADLTDGLLTINMDIVIPEEDKPRTIDINSAS